MIGFQIEKPQHAFGEAKPYVFTLRALAERDACDTHRKTFFLTRSDLAGFNPINDIAKQSSIQQSVTTSVLYGTNQAIYKQEAASSN